MNRHGNRGFTIIELLVVVTIVALLVGILLPAIGKARDNARVNVSKNNLRQFATAHKTYASDWADRHVTLVRDDLGRFGGDIVAYTNALYPQGGEWFENLTHPGIICGSGYMSGEYRPWGYWPLWDHNPMFQAFIFPDSPNTCESCTAWGWFRFGIQCRPMNQYLNGRWHDPVFFAPKDRVILDTVEPCFEFPGEVVGDEANGGIGPEGCNPGWGSYCLSPAGLFAPQVYSDNGQGVYWTPPWQMPNGYRVPSFGQARYSSLKTHMLEHHWLQNQKLACNSAFFGCEPYYFNHGFQSMPVTLFYDGSIRLMSVLEGMSSDRRTNQQSGHGLWTRDTSLGEDGYLIGDGYDFAATSYHILTIDGVRGRDTIGAE